MISSVSTRLLGGFGLVLTVISGWPGLAGVGTAAGAHALTSATVIKMLMIINLLRCISSLKRR